MAVGASRVVLRILRQVEDYRVNRTKSHSLTDILFITLCVVLSGADSWAEIVLFDRSKLEWLRRYLPLPNGIPSHDTFGRVFARLDPMQLEKCLGLSKTPVMLHASRTANRRPSVTRDR